MIREANEDGSDETQRMFNVTVILHQNSIDFYYTFKYLNSLNSEAEDIELTFEDLFIKLKKPSFEIFKKWRDEQDEAMMEIWLPNK